MGLTPADAKQAQHGPRRDSTSGHEIVRELEKIAFGLRFLFATGLAVQLALRQQNADQDSELADCLRSGVCNPASDLAQTARSLAERINGAVLPER